MSFLLDEVTPKMLPEILVGEENQNFKMFVIV